MAKFYFENCKGVPLYSQTQENVEPCANYSSYIIGIILTLIISIFVIFPCIVELRTNKRPEDTDQQDKNRKNSAWLWLFGSFVVLLIYWFIIGPYSVTYTLYSWKNYRNRIDGLKAKGMSEAEAQGQIQSLEIAQRQERALRSIGHNNHIGRRSSSGTTINIGF